MKKTSIFVTISLFCLLIDSSASGRENDCLRSSWDYVIVGDGTAGAALARELSNGNQASVLVLEWGKNLTDDPAVLNPDPFAYSNQLTYSPIYAVNPIILVNFPNMPTQAFTYSDGRMWGGSSAHNGLFAVRGTPEVYDRWASDSGEPRWSYNNMLPLFLATENYNPNGTAADPTQRGLNGPLYITQSAPVTGDPWANAVSIATGIPFADDYNNPDQGGNICVAAQQQWITPNPDSYRSFSANAFTPVGTIVDANGFGLHGRKLRIVSDAFVDKVILKKKKAIGVQFYVDGDINNVVFVKAKKKVILCAGAPRTPGILERSGIGNGSLLKSLGIDVIVDNPNVGENLYNHYGAGGVVVGTTTATPFLELFSDNGFGDGIRRIQGISLTPTNATIISTSGILISPKSKGSVHIVDKNPMTYPNIDLNMYSDGPVTTLDTDAYNIVTYLKTIKAIATQFGGALLSPPPAVYLGGDQALLTYAQTLANMTITYHIVGTTRMGTSPIDSVVDGNLHVFGVTHLMVADVSIEPLIADGNTAYAAYFIGLQAANIIKSGL